MFRIVYISAAKRPFLNSELTDLLFIARRNNGAVGVTGMLVYSSGEFLQVLEGEAANVVRIFDKISADRRHGNIMILQRGLGYGERLFGSWSMGFKAWSAAPADAVPINDRINLGSLDARDAIEFLRACSRSQN